MVSSPPADPLAHPPAYSPTLTALLDRVPEPPGGISTQWVDYEVDGTPCRGFLATPTRADESGAPPEVQRPAVLVLADWLGLHPYVQMRCEMLARLGYVAFAGDIYGAHVQATPQSAPQLVQTYYGDRPLWRTRITGAYEQMLAQTGVDASRTAAVGYCFGGGGVLELARTGSPVRGVVSFHGTLLTGAVGEAAGITAKLLVLTGASDPVVPDETLTTFMDDLRTAPHLDWQVAVYAGAMHAFTLPDANAPEHGALFDPVAERRSWAAMEAFLAEVLPRA